MSFGYIETSSLIKTNIDSRFPLSKESKDYKDMLKEFISRHQDQLESSNIPLIFWETLYQKLKDEIFDAGEVFQLALYDDPDDNTTLPVRRLIVSAPEGISREDKKHIYLIDHAWTYEVNRAKEHLEKMPNLLNRMCNMMGYKSVKRTAENKSERVQFVLNEMWKYNNTFSFNVGEIEDRLPLWYIMDEVGCAISHSNYPNFRSVPFMYLPNGCCYSLIFPIQDLEFHDVVTRDFLDGQICDPAIRRVLLLPWVPDNLDDDSFEQKEPDEEYFVQGRTKDSLPNLNENSNVEPLSSKNKIKVFSHYDCVNQYLTNPRFEITSNKPEADILWLTTHFKEYKELSETASEVYVNQFPFECVLTVKDLFSVTCRRKAGEKLYDFETLETFPSWFPTTYNLSTEVVQFVAYFKKREAKGLENYWICKPWNLARGMDMHITDNLNLILRLPSTGPKIVQRYVTKPVLYKRLEIGPVKFDIRYVVLLNSVKPLRAYAYTNFFLRFANKEFALNNFYDYEQHFTVMNYTEEAQLFHLMCSNFVLEWDKQYPDFAWKSYVEPKILHVLKEIFEGAVSLPPPKGLGENRQSRAMYAVDLILEWKNDEIQPVVLEVNFGPDCKRACIYYPEFFNDVFKCLFLDNNDSAIFHELFLN